MPILTEHENPPSKPFDCSIIEKEGTWWVAKVKPRQEKAFAFDLLEQGIDYYLPFYEKKTKRSDGKFRKSTLVLFPSYVPFVSEKPYGLLKKNRLATILSIEAQKRFKKEINQIYLAHTIDSILEPAPMKMPAEVGDAIEIIAGPLIGVQGMLSEITIEKAKVILEVKGLGNVKIFIDIRMIKKCGCISGLCAS